MIDSAPNLTCLDVETPFYPDLEGCKNLKVLKFHFVKCDHHTISDCPDLNLGSVMKMLTQVKDSLIELVLFSEGLTASVFQVRFLP